MSPSIYDGRSATGNLVVSAIDVVEQLIIYFEDNFQYSSTGSLVYHYYTRSQLLKLPKELSGLAHPIINFPAPRDRRWANRQLHLRRPDVNKQSLLSAVNKFQHYMYVVDYVPGFCDESNFLLVRHIRLENWIDTESPRKEKHEIMEQFCVNLLQVLQGFVRHFQTEDIEPLRQAEHCLYALCNLEVTFKIRAKDYDAFAELYQSRFNGDRDHQSLGAGGQTEFFYVPKTGDFGDPATHNLGNYQWSENAYDAVPSHSSKLQLQAQEQFENGSNRNTGSSRFPQAHSDNIWSRRSVNKRPRPLTVSDSGSFYTNSNVAVEGNGSNSSSPGKKNERDEETAWEWIQGQNVTHKLDLKGKQQQHYTDMNPIHSNDTSFP